MAADPNRVIISGENPFIRLSEVDDGANFTTNASFWRVLFSPGGPGHVLFLKSELTGGAWKIYTDNIGMTRWMQGSVQGMLNAELKDTSLPVFDAEFSRSGDMRDAWTERLTSFNEEIVLTWYQPGEPMLFHNNPNSDPTRYLGLCTLFVPCGGAQLTVNGVAAKGRAWPREREGRPFSTCSLAFAESWTEAR